MTAAWKCTGNKNTSRASHCPFYKGEICITITLNRDGLETSGENYSQQLQMSELYKWHC